MSEGAHFEQLLEAARSQPEQQRLLFVFAKAELPDDATPSQRERFQAGRGAALTPLMCVDKTPEELSGFKALVAESKHAGPPWQVVFAASLAGRDARPPTSAEVESALQTMVDAIQLGSVGRFAAYDSNGNPLEFG